MCKVHQCVRISPQDSSRHFHSLCVSYCIYPTGTVPLYLVNPGARPGARRLPLDTTRTRVTLGGPVRWRKECACSSLFRSRGASKPHEQECATFPVLGALRESIPARPAPNRAAPPSPDHACNATCLRRRHISPRQWAHPRRRRKRRLRGVYGWYPWPGRLAAPTAPVRHIWLHSAQQSSRPAPATDRRRGPAEATKV